VVLERHDLLILLLCLLLVSALRRPASTCSQHAVLG
jgi:hypothetical protein